MNETNDLSRAEQIQNQANQGWGRFILQPFCRILESQQCGMKMDLMQNQEGQTCGMVMVLTAGSVPPFSISYQQDQPSGILEEEG